MTTKAIAVIARLRQAGTILSVGERGVWFSSPEPLPKSLLAEARQHRDDICNALKAETAPAQSAAPSNAAARTSSVALAVEPSLHWPRASNDPGQLTVHDSRIAWHGVADLRHRPSWWRAEAHRPAPGATCSCCGGQHWWSRDERGWCCATCHPCPQLS